MRREWMVVIGLGLVFLSPQAKAESSADFLENSEVVGALPENFVEDFPGASSFYDAPILRVRSDASPGFSDAFVSIDPNEAIVKFVYKQSMGGRTEFSPSQLIYGVVLYRDQGRDVLKLQSYNLNPYSGGMLTLSYLTDAVWGRYQEFRMNLVHNGHHWTLTTYHNQPFTNMFLTGRRGPFGQWVGISDVRVW